MGVSEGFCPAGIGGHCAMGFECLGKFQAGKLAALDLTPKSWTFEN
jgi:hypothetical protein